MRVFLWLVPMGACRSPVVKAWQAPRLNPQLWDAVACGGLWRLLAAQHWPRCCTACGRKSQAPGDPSGTRGLGGPPHKSTLVPGLLPTCSPAPATPLYSFSWRKSTAPMNPPGELRNRGASTHTRVAARFPPDLSPGKCNTQISSPGYTFRDFFGRSRDSAVFTPPS